MELLRDLKKSNVEEVNHFVLILVVMELLRD